MTEVIDYKKIDLCKEKTNPELNEFTGTFVLLDDQHMPSKVYGLCLHMVDLASIILNERQLGGIIVYGLIPLTRILSLYLMVTAEEVKNWQEDSNQYIADDENEHDTTNIKVLAL